MQRIKIDVTKIDKSSLYVGKKGTYLDLTLMDNRDGTDDYGNDGFVVQDIGKERREAGERGEILGNWRHIGKPPQHQMSGDPDPGANYHKAAGQKPNAAAVGNDDTDDIPF